MSSSSTESSGHMSSQLISSTPQTSQLIPTSTAPVMQAQPDTTQNGYTEDECMYHVNGLPAQKAMYAFLGASLIINFGIFLWWYRIYYHRRKQRKREERQAYEEACEAWEAEQAREAWEAAQAEQAEKTVASSDEETGIESEKLPAQNSAALRQQFRQRQRQAAVNNESDEETVVERPAQTRAAMLRQMRQKKTEDKADSGEEEKAEPTDFQKQLLAAKLARLQARKKAAKQTAEEEAAFDDEEEPKVKAYEKRIYKPTAKRDDSSAL